MRLPLKLLSYFCSFIQRLLPRRRFQHPVTPRMRIATHVRLSSGLSKSFLHFRYLWNPSIVLLPLALIVCHDCIVRLLLSVGVFSSIAFREPSLVLRLQSKTPVAVAVARFSMVVLLLMDISYGCRCSLFLAYFIVSTECFASYHCLIHLLGSSVRFPLDFDIIFHRTHHELLPSCYCVSAYHSHWIPRDSRRVTFGQYFH